MPVVNYLTIDGEIVSETRNGVKSDYIPDPLGSTSKLVNTSQTVTDVFEYWPYGELRLHTGGSGTPFRFVGTEGYYTHSPLPRLYVRNSNVRVDLARWQCVDILWPGTLAYAYVYANPLTLADPTGTTPAIALPALFIPGVPEVVGGAIIVGVLVWAGCKVYDAIEESARSTPSPSETGTDTRPRQRDQPGGPIPLPKPSRQRTKARKGPKHDDKDCREHQHACNDAPAMPPGFSCWQCYRICIIYGGVWPDDPKKYCDYWNR